MGFSTIKDGGGGSGGASGGGDWADDLGTGAELDGVASLKAQGSAPSATADYGKIYALADHTSNANVKLLLHGNGADGATSAGSFVDSSATGRTPDAVGGNCQLDTAQKKFGTASILFDGTGDTLTYNDHADFDLGTGAFTIDCWFRMTDWDASGQHVICSAKADSSGFFRLRWDGDSEQFEWSNTASTVNFPATLSDNTWHHVAITRSGSSLRCFVDGVQKGSTESLATDYDGAGLVIGDTYSGGNGWDGWIDSFRFVKGEALWTAAFNTSSFIASASESEYAAAEIYVLDEGGNATRLSSHNSDGEWVYYSRNQRTGKTVRINMEEVVRDLGQLTGKNYIKDE